MAILNKQNLENIKSSNIFIAVLENISSSDKSFSEVRKSNRYNL